MSGAECFIKRHRHLPDVASASKMETEGPDIGQMNKKLLHKVEEQALYLIEIKRENTPLQQAQHDIASKLEKPCLKNKVINWPKGIIIKN